jgi:quercetin dioxygenase-like cupin family protein
MTKRRGQMARFVVAAAIVGGGMAVLLLARGPSAFAQTQSTFMGGTPSRMPSDKISTLRLKFPKGSRSNWHAHTWGQLLMVEEGRGVTQERGAPARIVLPGQPWFTKGGVEHWHGAGPDEDMLQLTIYEGEVKWLEPVTDDAYRAAVRAR